MRESLSLVLLVTAASLPPAIPAAPARPAQSVGGNPPAGTQTPGFSAAPAAARVGDGARPDSLNPFRALAAPPIRGGT